MPKNPNITFLQGLHNCEKSDGAHLSPNQEGKVCEE